MDQYIDLTVVVEQNPQLDLDQVGTRIILPSSFTGSTRHMQGICQDGLAVNCWTKGLDYFITMTLQQIPTGQRLKVLYFQDRD